ncbi:hypothetical protein ACJ41O_002421 [Fusarium nematophilum]
MEAVASHIPKEETEALKDQANTDDDVNRNGAAMVSESPTGTADGARQTGETDDKEQPQPGSSNGSGNGGGFGDSSKPRAPEVVQFTTNFTSSSYIFPVTSEPRDIRYKAENTSVIFKDVKWQYLDGKEWATITSATFKDDQASSAEAEEPFGDVSYQRARLEVADGSLDRQYWGLQMQIQIDWETDFADGWTKSDIFTVSNQNTAELQDTMQEANSNSGNELEDITPKGSETSTSDSTSSETAESSSSGGGGGLSTGATAGIAVGAVIGGLLIIGALVWFLLRRRRRSKQVGDDYTSQQAYAVDKETHGRATDSPNSPYSDENQVQPVALDSLNRDRDDPSFNAHGTPPPPRTSIGSRGRGGNSGAQTPQGVSSRVAHLVEDGMTPEEIRRLEEEERQLDDEIERAARR